MVTDQSSGAESKPPGSQTTGDKLPRCLGSRRRGPFEQRLKVDTSAVIHLISLTADIEGQIVDISTGGCRIRTERRFPVGIFRRVEVEFRIEGLPFRLGGVTQAIYDPFNVGIRFLDLSVRKREQLVQLIEEIRKDEEQHADAGQPGNSTPDSLVNRG